MGSYHFSASVVKRAAGRSAVAAAAYRAGERLDDQRYGETHDYTRKGGVLHSEIITPKNAPDWVHKRAQLWNAVEKIETRKNAQLARDITLALPTELNDAQRLELVRSFVQDQFVQRGMVADIAIHAPHRQGDDRNHHAHVMLTMRELLGDGFHTKKATPEARKWNETATLESWREAWADHQNCAYERHGIEASVDHRSFEAQGINKEPTQHEGPNATAMRRRGEETRIGTENDRRIAANDNRDHLASELASIQAEIAHERTRFAEWRLRAEVSLDGTQREDMAALSARHSREKQARERELKATYGPAVQKHRKEGQQIKQRLAQGGLRGLVRRMTGAQKTDEHTLEGHVHSIRDAKQRVQEQRDALAKKQVREQARLEERQKHQREDKQARLEKAQEGKDVALQSDLSDRLRCALEKAQADPAQREHAERVKEILREKQERETRAQGKGMDI